MKVSDLAVYERTRRLSTDGLTIRSGPFVYTIRTDIPQIASFIGMVYAEMPIMDWPVFSDFHLGVYAHRSCLRPWSHLIVVSESGVPLFPPCQRREMFAYLEWGMNACIARHAHHLFLFHAASLEVNGRGVLFLGKTGAGKSTLAAALVSRGWRLLSDEFGLVAMDALRLIPLARPICLKNEAIGLICSANPGAVITAPTDVQRKGLLCHLAPSQESVRRMDEPATPTALVFLNFEPGETSRLKDLPGGEAVKRAIECSFNYRELGRAGYDRLSDLIHACGCYELTYGNLDAAERVLEGVI